MYLAGAAAATQQFHLPWTRGLLFFCTPLVLLDTLIRWAVLRATDAFETQLQRTDPKELPRAFRAQRLLRFAACQWQLCRWRGQIYHKLGQTESATLAYRNALDDAPPRQQADLARLLADSLYASGDVSGAEHYYRIAHARGLANPGITARLARLVIERQGDRSEAEALLRHAVATAAGQAGCGLLRCQLARVLADNRNLDEAEWHLALAEEEVDDSDPHHVSELRAVREALENVRRE